uniref:hypothetical protein n=1 Tax=Accumulibacter sp. TaxID=2053492 RepID=UPI00261EF757
CPRAGRPSLCALKPKLQAAVTALLAPDLCRLVDAGFTPAPTSNDWALSWIRRTRDGGEWRDNVDASLSEASESYAIDVYADGSYAAVKRTITVSSPSCVYASTDQVSDFGANQATLYLKLYQISATVGRGYPLTTSITR